MQYNLWFIYGDGNDIYRERLMIGTGVAFASHLVVIYGCKNAALDHVIAASSSSWLQEHVSDISQRCAGIECVCLPVMSQMNKSCTSEKI